MYRQFVFLLLFLGFMVGIEAKTPVLVSIPPQKFLVERIGGENVHVEVIVPAGANAHTYEPTPKQVLAAQKGKIWFRLGENFEARLLPSLEKTVYIVDQREGIDLITAGCGCCHSAYDPHIWLSPMILKKQANQIAHVLSDFDAEHADFYAENLRTLGQELDVLDQTCKELLSEAQNSTILVSHPAFGYFCREYGLKQLSIEMEGREPTPRYLTDLILTARSLQIKTVFLQTQHNPKGGMRIAQEIGADTVYLDPYLENVIENLRNLAGLFGCHRS